MASDRPDLQAVVVPVNVDADVLVYRVLVDTPPQPMDEERLHPLLIRR